MAQFGPHRRGHTAVTDRRVAISMAICPFPEQLQHDSRSIRLHGRTIQLPGDGPLGCQRWRVHGVVNRTDGLDGQAPRHDDPAGGADAAGADLRIHRRHGTPAHSSPRFRALIDRPTPNTGLRAYNNKRPGLQCKYMPGLDSPTACRTRAGRRCPASPSRCSGRDDPLGTGRSLRPHTYIICNDPSCFTIKSGSV